MNLLSVAVTIVVNECIIASEQSGVRGMRVRVCSTHS